MRADVRAAGKCWCGDVCVKTLSLLLPLNRILRAFLVEEQKIVKKMTMEAK
jgi:hypothetical protein